MPSTAETPRYPGDRGVEVRAGMGPPQGAAVPPAPSPVHQAPTTLVLIRAVTAIAHKVAEVLGRAAAAVDNSGPAGEDGPICEREEGAEKPCGAAKYGATEGDTCAGSSVWDPAGWDHWAPGSIVPWMEPSTAWVGWQLGQGFRRGLQKSKIPQNLGSCPIPAHSHPPSWWFASPTTTTTAYQGHGIGPATLPLKCEQFLIMLRKAIINPA